jgi:hypothetical protein
LVVEKNIFVSRNDGFFLWHPNPVPGEWGLRLAIKRVASSSAGCGLPPFVGELSLPRVSSWKFLLHPSSVKAGRRFKGVYGTFWAMRFAKLERVRIKII